MPLSRRLSASAAIPLDLALFGLLAAGVYAVEAAVASRLGAAPHPGLLSTAVVVDLTLILPAAFGLLVVRRRRWPWLAVVPWAIAGMIVAGRLLPPENRLPLHVAHLAAAPLEIAVLVWIGRRAWQAARRARRDADGAGVDFPAAMTAALAPLLGTGRLAAIVAYEASVLAYAFGLAPSDRGHGETFTHHRDTAYAAVLGAFAMVGAMEVVGVHLLLARLDGRLAWLVTALSAYGAVWVVADLRAMSRRPSRIDDDGILLRVGLRRTVRLGWSDLVAIEDAAGATDGVRPLTLRVLGRPRFRLRLAAPVVAHGPYGIRRRVDVIDVAVDDPDRFERTVRERLAAGSGATVADGPRAGV